MSIRIKKYLSVITAVAIGAAFLFSCSGGIEREGANTFIYEFLDAIEAEDYEKAEGYLHPERPADIEAFIAHVEEGREIDFQKGIEIERITSFSSSYYDSGVSGSTYEPTIKTKVGDADVEITIEIVQNSGGYGIYNFDIDVD